MRTTVSLLSCCEARPSMCGAYYDIKCSNFLQIPQTNTYREALTASCSDLIDTVLALHSNSVTHMGWFSCWRCNRRRHASEQEAASLRQAAERRAQFGRLPARSVSAPSRKRWFWAKPNYVMNSRDGGGGSQEVVCDEFTKKLVAAITTWHDIHSSLLQLSYDRSSDSNDDENRLEGHEDTSSNGSWSSDRSNLYDAEDNRRGENANSEHLAVASARFSISNPDLTNCQIREMFPEMADHWR